MQKQIIIGLAICLTSSAFCADKSDTTAPMTLKDCMEYAVSNSTKIRIRQAAVGDAQIARRDAILCALTPQANFNTAVYYNFGRSIDQQTNTYFNITQFHNDYSINAGIDLFNGFSAVNNMRISKTALAIAQTEQKQAEADICLAVMQAYYNVLYYSKLQQIFSKQIEAAKITLSKMKRQEELGQKSHADVIQLEAELADREYDLANTRQIYNEQITTLSDLIFFPVNEQLVIDTVPPTLSISELSEQAVIDFALNNNNNLLVTSMNVDNARRELSTARWQMLPKLSAYAGWSTKYFKYKNTEAEEFTSQLKNHRGEYIELALTIPLFDRLKKYSTVSQKKNALVRATAEFEQKTRETESEVRKAFQECESALAAYIQAEKKTEIQQEAYQLNMKRMEQGLISGLEYQTAVNNYLKAKSDNLNSLFKFLIKQSVLRYYGGEEYIEQIKD